MNRAAPLLAALLALLSIGPIAIPDPGDTTVLAWDYDEADGCPSGLWASISIEYHGANHLSIIGDSGQSCPNCEYKYFQFWASFRNRLTGDWYIPADGEKVQDGTTGSSVDVDATPYNQACGRMMAVDSFGEVTPYRLHVAKTRKVSYSY